MPDTPINADYPAAEDLRLRIALGACRLRAEPGEGDAWITGICHDPTGKRVPTIGEEEGAFASQSPSYPGSASRLFSATSPATS
jgi:hypothetical protein